MNAANDRRWRSEAPHVRPQPNELSEAGGSPPRGGGRGVGGDALGVLREFNPVSWFHPRGIYRVLARLRPRLPDVGGMLFLTFTFNPLLYGDPLAAFEHGRSRLRRIFFRLRKGVVWEGKRYVINSPYAVKVEFHRSGWAHFHVVFLTHNYLPGPLLNSLWGLGRTNVRRISNRKFCYLLKYVTKGGGLPEWVLSRTRLRVFQSSRGFLSDLPSPGAPKSEFGPSEPGSVHVGESKRTRQTSTLGERLDRWRRTALWESGGLFRQVILSAPFFELVALLIFPAALERRYLGGGHFQINDIRQMEAWTM